MNICINELKQSLPVESWTGDADKIAPHLMEWRGRWNGYTPLMVIPESTEETARIVKICARHKCPVTTQGGNTGLVGGQNPKGEILLSTQRLNKIRRVSITNLNLVCESGVTLKEAQDAAEAHGLKFPLSLPSEGSCTIGGNLSTNAGGVHVVKYGVARELVFGVQAVLANGEIFHGLTNLHKDNTGYDLSRILLGAEGTLGILTAASLKLFPKPKEIIRVMVATSDLYSAQQLLEHCRIGNHLAMFELISRFAIDAVLNLKDQLRDPFTREYKWYCLLDWEFDVDGQGQEFAERVLQKAIEKEWLLDAVIANSGAQADSLLALREHISAAQNPLGKSIKHDITVPIAKVAEFIATANADMERLVPNCRPMAFGHFGDGNVHYDVLKPAGMADANYAKFETAMHEAVYDIVGAMDGSISAEHGIGILKKKELAKRADPVKLAMMKTLKDALDPDHILNPRVMI